MKSNDPYRWWVPPRGGAPEDYERAMWPGATAERAVDTDLEALKTRLLKEHLAQAADLTVVPALRRAANEAAALAWLTPYPLLVLPALLEEKAAVASRHTAKQASIRRRSRVLWSGAV